MPTQSKKPKKNRKRNQLLITAGVIATLALGLGIAVLMSLPEEADQTALPAQQANQQASQADQSTANQSATLQPEASAQRVDKTVQAASDQLIEDNGRTLWVSPTAGQPLPAELLPPGSQLMIWLRPAELFANDVGKESARVFESQVISLAGKLKSSLNLQIQEIESLAVAVRPGETIGTLDVTLVVRPDGFTSVTGSDLNSVPQVQKRGGQSLLEFSNKQYVLGNVDTLAEIVELRGESPPLSREMEQLLEVSDSARHASLLVAPSFLFAEGKPIFSGGAEALEEPLFEQLPDDLRGVLASAHCDSKRFFWELRAAARADLPAPRLSGRFIGQIEKWPQQLQLALLELSPHPHSRRLVANLPAMARVMSRYARRGVINKQVVLNGYLPPTAGHNLLMAAELMLAQQSGGGTVSSIAASPTTSEPAEKTIEQRLQQNVTVSFDRDTLEMSLRILAEELEVPISIAGGDLQLEGITKNQSFGLDLQNQPAGQVLVEILRRANPDKTATGPADTKQKLVYVIGEQKITVTTRAAAKKRGEQLPAIFGVE